MRMRAMRGSWFKILPTMALLAGSIVAQAAATTQPMARDLPLHLIELPSGFNIEVYADNVPAARSMALGPKGTLFVGTRTGDAVRALRDLDGDGRAEDVRVIASGLRTPNGVAMRGNDLYIGEIHRISRLEDIEDHLDNPPKPVVLLDTLPRARHHGWKFIRFGPDGMLYIPVGAPCNVCDEPAPYASILRFDLASGKLETYASGVRNSVGFDWHPETGELWFTDNGRDGLGDNVPPDELNHAPRPGLHFGFPFCHGGDIPDPGFGDEQECALFAPPAQRLGPHVASLGMRFYTGAMFPAAYRGQIFIAEHGSWNRSKKIGYRISLVRLEAGRVVSYAPFAQGWLQGERAWGRPVDVLNMPDGSLLVSDDGAGAIYRISYGAE